MGNLSGAVSEASVHEQWEIGLQRGERQPNKERRCQRSAQAWTPQQVEQAREWVALAGCTAIERGMSHQRLGQPHDCSNERHGGQPSRSKRWRARVHLRKHAADGGSSYEADGKRRAEQAEGAYALRRP